MTTANDPSSNIPRSGYKNPYNNSKENVYNNQIINNKYEDNNYKNYGKNFQNIPEDSSF